MTFKVVENYFLTFKAKKQQIPEISYRSGEALVFHNLVHWTNIKFWSPQFTETNYGRFTSWDFAQHSL